MRVLTSPVSDERKATAASPPASARRALTWALLPLLALMIAWGILALSGATTASGRGDAVSLAVDGSAPVATVGRGARSGDAYVLEVPTDGAAAVAVWPMVPSGLVDFAVVRCDCVARRVDADVRLVWRRADRPNAIFNAPFDVDLGVPRPLDLSRNPDWTGQVIGIGVAVRGYAGDVLDIRGVQANKADALHRLYSMFVDWQRARPWNGQSINLVIVGDPGRAASPVVIVAVLAGLGLLTLLVTRPSPRARGLVIVAVVAAGWLVLDMRWLVDLATKVNSTLAQYGGRSIEERWRAAPDGDIYALAAAVKQNAAEPGTRVFVFGDEAYARGRAAYHLLPLPVYHDVVNGQLPDAAVMRAGDLVFVLWTRRVRFDREASRLLWDTSSVHVMPLLALHGMAVFRVQP